MVFLTGQMRQAEDPVFQDLLQRARSATLTEDDVATLNSCTTENRVANGETPPERAIIRLNRIREEVNLVHLRVFAEKRGQKIRCFPNQRRVSSELSFHVSVCLACSALLCELPLSRSIQHARP